MGAHYGEKGAGKKDSSLSETSISLTILNTAKALSINYQGRLASHQVTVGQNQKEEHCKGPKVKLTFKPQPTKVGQDVCPKSRSVDCLLK